MLGTNPVAVLLPALEKKEPQFCGSWRGVFRALDKVSEASEIVDAIWRALPENARSPQRKRGLIDSAGQYGIDGADWKLAQIWMNIDDVDWQQAIRNILANEVEDRIIGGVQGTVKKPIVVLLDRSDPSSVRKSPAQSVPCLSELNE